MRQTIVSLLAITWIAACGGAVGASAVPPSDTADAAEEGSVETGAPDAAAPEAGSDAPADICSAWDAVAEGEGGADACGFLGFAYNGRKCVRLVGCECVGVDCSHLYADGLSCAMDHATCPHGDGGP